MDAKGSTQNLSDQDEHKSKLHGDPGPGSGPSLRGDPGPGSEDQGPGRPIPPPPRVRGDPNPEYEDRDGRSNLERDTATSQLAGDHGHGGGP